MSHGNEAELRVGIYLPVFRSGGAERLGIELANALKGGGAQVTLFTDSPQAETYFSIEVPVVPLGARTTLGLAYRLGSAYEKRKLNAVICILNSANLVATIAKLLRYPRMRFITTWHGHLAATSGTKGRLAHLLVSPITGLAAANVAVAPELREELVGFGAARSRFVVIPNGAAINAGDTRFCWPRPFILSIGRLVREKRHALLIAAFSLIADRIDHDLLIAGEGPLHAELLREAVKHGLADRVHLLGFRKDAIALHSEADLYVHAASTEAFGLVLIEALAAGVRVVSTDTSGARLVLDHGLFGRLTPIDDVESLASSMRVQLTSSVDRERLRRRAAEFDIKQTASAYMKLVSGN